MAAALGADLGDPLALAQMCQRAEQRAVGVPCGIMDQLVAAAGVAGASAAHRLPHARRSSRCRLPEEVEVVVVHSGDARELAKTAYAERRAECEAAEEEIGRRCAT